jgi:hypothetical protein
MVVTGSLFSALVIVVDRVILQPDARAAQSVNGLAGRAGTG